jgi:hypothetical protein
VEHVGIADWVVAGEFFVALLALIYFVVGYIASSRGRAFRSPEGRHLLSFRGSLAVFMAIGVINNLSHDYPGRDALRIVVIGWFALSAIQGVTLMTRAQNARRRARQAAKSAP